MFHKSDDDNDDFQCSFAQNCRQKEAVLHPENNQIIYLTEREGWTGCSAPLDGYVHCETAQSFESARERWWFIAVSRCGTIEVRYLQLLG